MDSAADDAWARVFAFSGSIVFVGTVLTYLKPILVPFVLAIFLAYLVRPFAEWISEHLCPVSYTHLTLPTILLV